MTDAACARPDRTRLGLVTGATGYVGGELVGALLERGWRVRVLSRSVDKVQDADWGDRVVDGPAAAGQVEVVAGDATEDADLRRALEGVDVAWYLLHSMGDADDFQQAERDMARSFAEAARTCEVSRIVYLGGLHPEGDELSEHLASRVEVGQILMASGVPTAVLQAGVVLGDRSQSFVMLRHLAERLPGAIGPSWLQNEIQPIAVADVLHYLVTAADLGPEHNREFDVAGPDVVSYAQMMSRYAEAVGLGPRLVLTAPVTTPRAAARWIGLVTPVPHALAEPLVGSLLHDTVADEHDLADLVGEPEGGATGFEDAVRAAARGQDTRRWRRTLAGTSAAVALTAGLGSLATDPTSRWYRRLDKPAVQPPGWVFPVVWMLLYADVAVVGALSLADLAETGREDERHAYLTALGVNLALNAGWSAVFFRGHRLPLATAEAALLALSSADLVRRSGRVSAEKAVVLAPYAAWTAFATVLTAAIARRNR
ncbi:tryptophan-rich sensory protein [Arsenicicoccus dermatophilus]|uniref:tryptophan-rich sensory protein n=1 Tax=Arsenicicoccus dermatophilus TaxID=1076331 RepID=UPI0039174867